MTGIKRILQVINMIGVLGAIAARSYAPKTPLT
jgi:hypothetical protein